MNKNLDLEIRIINQLVKDNYEVIIASKKDSTTWYVLFAKETTRLWQIIVIDKEMKKDGLYYAHLGCIRFDFSKKSIEAYCSICGSLGNEKHIKEIQAEITDDEQSLKCFSKIDLRGYTYNNVTSSLEKNSLAHLI